jgi:hypothetical protein
LTGGGKKQGLQVLDDDTGLGLILPNHMGDWAMLKLKKESLEWALNLAINNGDTDIFPTAFEFDAILHDAQTTALGYKSIIDEISEQNILDWKTRPFRSCLIPKHQYGFRVSTQLDPLDFLVYTALIYELAPDIESRRVHATENIVHSYRFRPTGNSMFDPYYNYSTFRRRSQELANTDRFSHVVVADIADFFPRLYRHRVENALKACTTKTSHVTALDGMLNQWTEHYSYGIPVGPTASRLIAEISLDDVDRLLLSEGMIFVRFSDDYRIFCSSAKEAYEKLAFLANAIFSNHGLTFQQSKTKIVTLEAFKAGYLLSEEAQEFKRLSERFYEILDETDIDHYEVIEWDDLTEAQQDKLKELNLVGIIEEQVKSEEIDIGICKFVLRRLSQLGNDQALDILIDNIDRLYPVFPDVVRYVTSIRLSDVNLKKDIGNRMLELLSDTTVSHLEYHRMWLLNMFTYSTEWNNQGEFVRLFNEATDDFSKRELILALGRSRQDYWFRARKVNLFQQFTDWSRRAFLAAASCLPTDERKHWYHSLESRLDRLEIAVIRWARQNPF